jgi:hypothetical protein
MQHILRAYIKIKLDNFIAINPTTASACLTVK